METENKQIDKQNLKSKDLNSKLRIIKTLSVFFCIFLIVFNIIFLIFLFYKDSLYELDFSLKTGKDTLFNRGFINTTNILENIVLFVNQLGFFYLLILLGFLAILYLIKRKRNKKILSWLIPHFLFFIVIIILYTVTNYVTHIAKKPVIYLYPDREEKVEVILNFKGQIIKSEPNYNTSWHVIAYPDGHLINQENKAAYPYLFWEGKFNKKPNWDFTQGFIIKGEETKEFLENKLKEIGLVSREYNEFIKYWSPLLEKNRYNLIHFASGIEYTSLAELNIKPNPDSVLRVFMVYRSLKSLKNIFLPQSQTFSGFKRAGFTAVEWGGMEDK